MVFDRDPTLKTRPYLFDPSGGEIEIELVGTVGDPVVSDRFRFQSAQDSNVVVELKPGNRPGARPVIEVGVYYV